MPDIIHDALEGVGTATAGPWSWEIHDGSMASLTGPHGGYDHVMSVSPCASCEREEWEWGNCRVPSRADADLIAAAPALLSALVDLRKRFHAALLAGGTDPEFADLACAKADAALALAGRETAP